MISRRQIVAGAAAVALAPIGRAFAMLPVLPAPALLTTRLFNFRDDVDPAAAAAVVARMRALAGTPGVNGVMVGRNFVPDPFPARFEWLSMVQFKSGPGQEREPYEAVRADLARMCRSQVACNVHAEFADGYGSAPGVGVRHTVMFDFRPDASPTDRTRNVEAIRAMGKLPMVRSYRIEPGQQYVTDPAEIQMQWQVIADFDNVADYRGYSAAPVHLAIRDDFRAHTSRVAFLDMKP
jgi:hypothetical protein